MPLYSDPNYYYGSSQPQPSSYYLPSSSYTPITSRTSAPYSFSYMSPISAMLSASIGSNPLPRGLRSYSPMLTSISESSLAMSPLVGRTGHRNSPRLSGKTYLRQPRPITIDTENIDFSKRSKEENGEESTPGMISRQKTLVRMHTRKLKENPLLKKKKSQAELLMEKYLIKEKPSKEENIKNKRDWEDQYLDVSKPARRGTIKRQSSIVKVPSQTHIPDVTKDETEDKAEDLIPATTQRKMSTELLQVEAALFDCMIQEEMGFSNLKEMTQNEEDSNVKENANVVVRRRSRRDHQSHVRKSSSHDVLVDENGTPIERRRSHRKRSSKVLPLDEANKSSDHSADSISNQEDVSNKVKRKSTKIRKPLKFKIDALHVEEKSSPKVLRKFKYEVIVEEGDKTTGKTAQSEHSNESLNQNIPDISKCKNVTIEDKPIDQVVIANVRLANDICDKHCDKTENVSHIGVNEANKKDVTSGETKNKEVDISVKCQINNTSLCNKGFLEQQSTKCKDNRIPAAETEKNTSFSNTKNFKVPAGNKLEKNIRPKVSDLDKKPTTDSKTNHSTLSSSPLLIDNLVDDVKEKELFNINTNITEVQNTAEDRRLTKMIDQDVLPTTKVSIDKGQSKPDSKSKTPELKKKNLQSIGPKSAPNTPLMMKKNLTEFGLPNQKKPLDIFNKPLVIESKPQAPKANHSKSTTDNALLVDKQISKFAEINQKSNINVLDPVLTSPVLQNEDLKSSDDKQINKPLEKQAKLNDNDPKPGTSTTGLQNKHLKYSTGKLQCDGKPINNPLEVKTKENSNLPKSETNTANNLKSVATTPVLQSLGFKTKPSNFGLQNQNLNCDATGKMKPEQAVAITEKTLETISTINNSIPTKKENFINSTKSNEMSGNMSEPTKVTHPPSEQSKTMGKEETETKCILERSKPPDTSIIVEHTNENLKATNVVHSNSKDACANTSVSVSSSVVHKGNKPSLTSANENSNPKLPENPKGPQVEVNKTQQIIEKPSVLQLKNVGKNIIDNKGINLQQNIKESTCLKPQVESTLKTKNKATNQIEDEKGVKSGLLNKPLNTENKKMDNNKKMLGEIGKIDKVKEISVEGKGDLKPVENKDEQGSLCDKNISKVKETAHKNEDLSKPFTHESNKDKKDAQILKIKTAKVLKTNEANANPKTSGNLKSTLDVDNKSIETKNKLEAKEVGSGINKAQLNKKVDSDKIGKQCLIKLNKQIKDCDSTTNAVEKKTDKIETTVKDSKKKRIKSESDAIEGKDSLTQQSKTTDVVGTVEEKSKSLGEGNSENTSKKKKKSKEKSTGSDKDKKHKSPNKSKVLSKKSTENYINSSKTSTPSNSGKKKSPKKKDSKSKLGDSNESKETDEKPSEMSKRSARLMHFINKCVKLSADNESLSVEISDEDLSTSSSSSEYTSDSEYTTDSDDTSTDDTDGSSSESRGERGSPVRRQSNAALSLEEPQATPAPGHGRVTPPATTIPRFRKYTMDDFQFLKVLGKGSFGKVLLAELRGTQYYYAVKCLKKDVVLEDDDVECTLIERKVLALGTNHPYLCHLFCTFQTESHLFFVMEYLNGGDLMFHIQQQGRFDEGRARFYSAEIVSGLKFLHKKGIVYRDLKLDNILLDFDGHVRIADFGMCKLQIFLDRTADTFCGTPDYMAPEIIKGQKYNQCVDWWSFGILMYEMLVGQSPFSGCDEDDLFWTICNRQPHYPRFISLEAKRILMQLLEKEASKRLGSCEGGAEEVMGHPFFNGLDWDRLERRELMPPFKPNVKHPLDVHYFDKHFTVERACLTPIDPSILQSMDQTQFQGFSYTNPNVTEGYISRGVRAIWPCLPPFSLFRTKKSP